MKRRYIIIGASILLLGFLLFSGYRYEKNLYEDEIQRLYNSKILEFQQRLKASELERLAAIHRADSIDSAYKIVVARDSINQLALKNVPGQFKSLTSKQLEQKMNEEYAKTQH